MNQDALWDYYQNRETDVFSSAHVRLRLIAGMVPVGARVLNIGVGNGAFEVCAVERQLDVHVLDPDPKAIASVRERLRLGERAQVGRAEAIPFPDAFFDAVVMSEVLEHLDDQTLAACREQVQRVLKPAGRFIITVPARENLADQQVFCPHCGHQHHRWGHLQSFDPTRMRTWLGERFQVDSVIERPLVAWTGLNWKGRLLASAKLALYRLGIHGTGEIIIAVAHKHP